MSIVNAGALGRKEQQREADFGANGNKAMKYLSRRDVPTSRRGVNNCKSQQAQRRDVSTLRRQLENCIPSFKAAGVLKLGYREAYERRHGFPEQSDTDFEGVPGICTAFHFLDIGGY